MLRILKITAKQYILLQNTAVSPLSFPGWLRTEATSSVLHPEFIYHLATSQGNCEKCPTCSLYNQTPLPAVSNHKGRQRNGQLGVFYSSEFGKLKYLQHTIVDTFLGF